MGSVVLCESFTDVYHLILLDQIYNIVQSKYSDHKEIKVEILVEIYFNPDLTQVFFTRRRQRLEIKLRN